MQVQHDSDLCERFETHTGVKQGCVLAVTLFSMEFLLLLNHVFSLFFNRCFSTQKIECKTKCLLIPKHVLYWHHHIQYIWRWRMLKLLSAFLLTCNVFELIVHLRKKPWLYASYISWSESRCTTIVLHVFYFVIWSGLDNLLLDIEINPPIKKVTVKIQAGSKPSVGKQPMRVNTKIHTMRCALCYSTVWHGKLAVRMNKDWPPSFSVRKVESFLQRECPPEYCLRDVRNQRYIAW